MVIYNQCRYNTIILNLTKIVNGHSINGDEQWRRPYQHTINSIENAPNGKMGKFKQNKRNSMINNKQKNKAEINACATFNEEKNYGVD